MTPEDRLLAVGSEATTLLKMVMDLEKAPAPVQEVGLKMASSLALILSAIAENDLERIKMLSELPEIVMENLDEVLRENNDGTE